MIRGLAPLRSTRRGPGSRPGHCACGVATVPGAGRILMRRAGGAGGAAEQVPPYDSLRVHKVVHILNSLKDNDNRNF